MKRIILFGAPGSGKGTQGDKLAETYGYTKISTGDLIRAEVAAESDIGRRVKRVMESGELVSDEIIMDLLKNRLNRGDIADGYILDGFPRTLKQAESLSDIPCEREVPILLEVDAEEVTRRLLSRWTCTECGAIFNQLNHPPKVAGVCDLCGGKLMQRSDDNAETIRNRIDVYERETGPVIDYYQAKSRLKRVNASQPIDAVFSQIKEIVE